MPRKLKLCVVRPIFKGGSKAVYNNYRPISLVPLISKILETHVSDKLEIFFEKHNIIDPNQFGFQRRKGTNDLLEIFTNLLNNSLNDHIHVLVFLSIFLRPSIP